MRFASAIGLALLCAISIVRVGRPPNPVRATAPDTVFSAERAMRHVEQIAVRPHAMGMADHDRVRDYIVAQLTALGLRSQIQRATAIGTRYQAAGRVENILAWMPGTKSNGKAVLLVAHYDGVEASPAAADDGAASAALLETLRALRARKQPLADDVFALFTDGEESGLLGAAAFVREHPWAKDVGVALNFEARGTTGRSFMFETGPGNLDVARVLGTAGDVTAGSTFTTIYRILPNDTDLSELSMLGTPALNFAFADGVERYHTSHDDLAHLNPGSVQHHGAQMLALAKRFASEPLPRPQTGDAVFFDLPVIGLVVYPQWLAIPLAIVALILVSVLVRRVGMSVATGAAVALAAAALSACAAWGIGGMLNGPARWSGWYAAVMALVVVAITMLCRMVARRWCDARALDAGALVIWLVLAVATSVASPGVSYLLVWPLLFAAAAALATRFQILLQWIAAAITLLVLVGFVYGAAVIMLGLTGVAAIALGVLGSLVVSIVGPQVDAVAGESSGRWSVALWPLVFALGVLVRALLTVHPNAEHPDRTALMYVENADSSDAWLGGYGRAWDSWTRAAIGPVTPPPQWTGRMENLAPFSGRSVARVPLDPPNATLARDTVINGARRVVLRVFAPHGTTALTIRAPGAHVLTASIDGRIVDTTRYRRRPRDWVMEYWAVPDSGAVVALSIPLGAKLDLELSARRPGLPAIPGVNIPVRPAAVVESQSGDVAVVYRRMVF